VGDPVGQRVADFLVANADNLGIQSVIYNRRVWGYGRYYWRAYTGVNPHVDHVHTGMNWAAARSLTDANVEAVFARSGGGAGQRNSVLAGDGAPNTAGQLSPTQSPWFIGVVAGVCLLVLAIVVVAVIRYKHTTAGKIDLSRSSSSTSRPLLSDSVRALGASSGSIVTLRKAAEK
jgi:hypothetical protein